MKTNNTKHLGDGAYVGQDPWMRQIWLGANHHESMTVALGPVEALNLIRYALNYFPEIKDNVRALTEPREDDDKFSWKAGDLKVD